MSRIISAGAATREARAAAVTELVGDGSKIDAHTFAVLQADERMALYNANPDKYRELRDAAERTRTLAGRQLGGAK